jgi:hypothetical protein
VILNKRDNEVIGKNGNKERFYFVRIAKKAWFSFCLCL